MNQQVPAVEAAAPQQAPAAATTTAPASTEEAAVEAKPRVPIHRSLRPGRSGDDVRALQEKIGFKGDEVDGSFGSGTADKLKTWQKENGLAQSGVAGKETVAKMKGDECIYGYSFNHDPEKFAPKYPMTAYHESGIYRSADDPYAVGAITRPTKEQDMGGKTYGTYQFESYHYPDGTKNKKHAGGSTIQRFTDWEDNPYGEALKGVVAKHGMASAAFDAAWKKLSGDKNKAFGGAQERFLEHDQNDAVQKLLKNAGASDEAKKDPRLFDLAMGTRNQYGGLATGHAAAAATAQKASGKTFSANELGTAIQTSKAANVTKNFKGSPKAWPGIRDRISDEKAVFKDTPAKAATP
ncbi:MAG: hypothetical protein GWP91_16345 [Rhodobacterales bacterium]|nr:hypothetical protein [Rhodobacterales bacterium]